MGNYIKIGFENLEREQREILIAQLSDIGFDGFEETEKGLEAFITEDDYNEDFVNDITGDSVEFTKSIVAPKNWNEEWESNFHPVIVNDFVAVRAGFHEPVPGVQHEIVITPKMSFGTGHHATTHMMMQQMQSVNFTGKKVFDFGTGTGILAILAAKLGAISVTAIDNDEWSFNNATENIQLNHCETITLQLADHPFAAQLFDVILANITKNIILENFYLLSDQLNKNGILVLSGLLLEDEKEIVEAAKKYSLTPELRLEEGNWLCMRFLR